MGGVAPGSGGSSSRVGPGAHWSASGHRGTPAGVGRLPGQSVTPACDLRPTQYARGRSREEDVDVMQVFDTVSGLRECLAAHRTAGKRIGLVPTMGYLHAGHISL